jgi:hypothetical protein
VPPNFITIGLRFSIKRKKPVVNEHNRLLRRVNGRNHNCKRPAWRAQNYSS